MSKDCAGTQAPRRGGADVWLLLIILMAAGIAALGWFAWNKHAALKGLEQTGIDTEIGDLKDANKKKAVLLRLHRNAPVFAGNDQALNSFLTEQAAAAGVVIQRIVPIMPPRKVGDYQEFATKLTIQNTTRGTTFVTLHHMTAREVRLTLAGGLLNSLRDNGKN